MATLFEKIKRCLGIIPDVNYGSFYKIEEKTGEPVKVSYAGTPAPVAPPVAEEPAVDTKDDGIDLAAMTKSDLLAFAKDRGISGVSAKMKKQDIVDTINAAL